MHAHGKALLRASALLALGLAAACVNVNTQRWPGPIRSELDPLPPGDSNLHPPGSEEVSVIRHADPVRVRPPGVNSGRPLTFYDKQVRLNAGSQVVVAPGGRAEILWPEGASVVLFGRAVAWIGSPSRGEAMLDLRDVERARVMIGGEDRIRLVGGALLSGAGGPYLLSRDPNGTLAVHNQSKGGMTVAFREEVFEMGPGQRVLLPLLSSGGSPFEPPDELERIPGPGFSVEALGDTSPIRSGGRLRLTASEASEVSGLGVRVRLAPGAQVTFSDLPGGVEEEATAPIPADPIPADPAPAEPTEALPAEPAPDQPPEALPIEDQPEGEPVAEDPGEDSEGR